MGQLDGKIAIITGAGTGIGKGIARGFAREGASLVIASRNRQNLEATADELRPLGAKVMVVPTDVTDEAQVVALFQRTMEEFGRVDTVVNNSGVFDGGLLIDLSLETWQKVMDVNLTGVFLGTREAMRIMKSQGGGRIINVGSISAQMPRVGSVAYATTKHALVGLTHSAALEGREFGITACALHPGNVLTERRDDGGASTNNQEPMITPDELAMVAVTMAALPSHVNLYEAIILPTEQLYLGRG